MRETEAWHLQGLERFVANYKRALAKMDMTDWLTRACARVQHYAQAYRFRASAGSRDKPPVPGILTHRNTPGLRGAIMFQVTKAAREWIGRVGIAKQSPAADYAAIHEFGGWAGRNLASHIPPRPYLNPALVAMREKIISDYKNAVWTTCRESGLI
jgi:phage gpG-like protein